MAPTELSVDALKALLLLEEGARLNMVSRLARELIALGLAEPGWGDALVISEAGRRRARSSVRSEHVADLSLFTTTDPNLDPMATPQVNEPFEIAPEGPAVISDGLQREVVISEVVISDELQRALRAAGVASGVTDVWVDEKWVKAFVEAWLGNR